MITSSLSIRTIRHRAARLAAVRVVATLLTAVAMAACNDNPLGLRASLSVRFDTLAAYTMSGTPVTFPAAFDAGNSAVVRIATDVAFDVAFDFASTGNGVMLVPARQVSAVRDAGTGIPSSSRRVGLLKATGSFESINRAPTGGYTYDSTMVVNPGEPVVMEVTSDVCQFSLASNIYAKLVVDSISRPTRQVFFRTTVDPNCGFRSFTPGVPKN